MKIMQLGLADDTRAQLEQRAYSEDVSMTDVIREALFHFFEAPNSRRRDYDDPRASAYSTYQFPSRSPN